MAGNAAVAARMRKAAALMRTRGLKVEAMAGWEDRGRSAAFNPRAVLLHHTAAAVDVDRILRDGRSDLPGPLCNWALHADGTWVAVAAGRANHAGVGTLPSSESFGVEATGPNHPRASGPGAFDNYAAYAAGVGCILEAEGWDTGVVWGHKETARPVGRKVDPAFDVRAFEAEVRRVMAGEDDMPLNDADKDWIVQKLEESERRVARYVDHGDAAITGSGNHHARVREDLAQLKAQQVELKAAVDRLTLELAGDAPRTTGSFSVVGTLDIADVQP